MNGLECSEVMLSALERTARIDAEFYQKESFKVLDLISRLAHKHLTEYVSISDGNHMTISNKFIESGIPYYRGQDVKNFFVENSNPICIDGKTYDTPYLKRSHLQKGDVLLSIVGTIGSLALVYSSKKATCSCKLAILRPNSNTSAEVIATFLCSKYGQNQIKKFTRGAVQMGLILEDMDQLIVPEFQNNMQESIKNLVAMAFKQNSQAERIYLQAEQLLLTELGMADFTSSAESVSIKSLSESFCSSGRLDAEYYQPKYEEYLQCIQNYSRGYLPVHEKFSQIKTPFQKTKKEYPYIEIGDINIGDGTYSYNIISAKDLPANAKIKVQVNDLLVSKVRPYRGAVSIITQNVHDQDLIVSGAFTVLRQKTNYPIETLAVLFKTPIYKDWFLKWNVGTSYPVIRDEDVMNIPIPLFSEDVHEKIKDAVISSSIFKQESEQLLEAAKQAVEMAIEQGEEKAMEWLKEKGVRVNAKL